MKDGIQHRDARKDFGQGRDRSLKRRVVIDRVFAEGHASKGFPLIARFSMVPPEGNAPSRAAFTVSKKRFRRAVDRNAIKRRMREAWRHNRGPFESLIPEGAQCAVVLIFVGKDLPGPEDMEKGMVKLLTRMAQAIQSPDA